MRTLRFSGLYYSQALRDLTAYWRSQLPEVNDEDENEPFVQLRALMALVLHYQSVLLDHVALESLLSTCRTRTGIESNLALLGVKLKQDIPATVDLIGKLSAVQTAEKTIPEGTRFETSATPTLPAIVFETISAETLSPGDSLTLVKADVSGVWSDLTDVANGVDPIAVDPLGGAGSSGDAVYFGHRSVMPTKIMLTFPSAEISWDQEKSAWEYYDGQIDQTYPSVAADQGAGVVRLNLTPLLGTKDRSGAEVWVTSARTGGRKMVVSSFSTVNYVDVTVSQIGLSSVTTTVSEYLIGSYWREVPDFTPINYSSSSTTRGGTWSLPETATRRWQRIDLSEAVDGAPETAECYWLRLRVTSGSGTGFDLQTASINYDSQYVKLLLAQGQTQVDVMGASTSAANQTFSTAYTGVIEGSFELALDEGSGYEDWTQVDDFLTSVASDKHYRVTYDSDGTAVVALGDGTNGKIPAVDSSVRATYRTGARQSGNVAASSITANTSGISFFSQVWNPRAAAGWKLAEGSTIEDIDRLRFAGPASLRAMERIVTPEDASTIALAWENSQGISPFVRAKVVEEAYGPKTVGIIVVESGGQAPDAILQEFEDYLNGESADGTPGKILYNHRATVARYTATVLNVALTVKGTTAAAVKAVLEAFLSPTAVDSDGNWLHDFGSTIYLSKIVDVAFTAAGCQNVTSVTIAGLAADYELGTLALPVAGTISVTVV